MQAMIITAYKDYDALSRVVRALSAMRCALFMWMRAAALHPRQVLSWERCPACARPPPQGQLGRITICKPCLIFAAGALRPAGVLSAPDERARIFQFCPAHAFIARFEGETRIFQQRLRTADDPELRPRYEHYHIMHLLNYRDPSDRVQNWVGLH